MAKRKKSSRQGRSGDPRQRAEADQRRRAEAGPELEEEVAAALAAGHPLDIMMLASALIASLDPGSAPAGADLPQTEEIVRMFLESGDPDLQVLAWVVSQLLPEPRVQVAADLAVSVELVPDWLLALPQASAVSTWQTTDPLQDSTDIVVSLRIGEADLSVVGLLDLNSGGAVKDALAVPAPLSAVQEALGASGRTGMVTRDLDPAEAAAWLGEGIAVDRELDEPFTSDTWPQLRPLLEWALRLCPPGSEGWRPDAWTTEEIETVVADFAASPDGEVAADPQDQQVLVSALQTVGRFTGADPRLLSPVRLEIGLGYLWSTALHFELDRLLTLPEMLGPYVRWTHAQQGIPAVDTEEALAAIAHRRAEYVRDVTAVAGGPDDDEELTPAG